MKKRYFVELADEERKQLEHMIHTGKAAAYQLDRARVLLKADRGRSNACKLNREIADAVEISVTSVERIRKAYCEEGLEAALNRKKQPPRPDKRKLDGEGEAHLVALACGQPPNGQGKWTLKLLADQMVALHYVDSVSDDTVRRVLKKTNLSRGSRKSGAYRPRRTRRLFAEWKTS